ncbi:MAG TPA: hypothetical protein VFB50_14745, partial [Chloroflexota bacterium]|nr:hypothetical protein [Chloroflexota bacterium]
MSILDNACCCSRRIFGTSDGYWINLQWYYALEMAKDKGGKKAVRIGSHPPWCGRLAAARLTPEWSTAGSTSMSTESRPVEDQRRCNGVDSV